MIRDTIGEGDSNLAYLYGISDFWTTMFEEYDVSTSWLESYSLSLSDSYSKFLQLTTAISLEGIQTGIMSSVALLVLSSDDLIADYLTGEGLYVYKLPYVINKVEKIGNRPMLPTEILESRVDYKILDNGTKIAFSKPLPSYLFPSKLLPNGVTAYSLWMSEVVVDEQLIYNHFGKLIGVSPEQTTENYKNYVSGIYFLYSTGPTIANIKLGINLSLGIPATRETETVVDIRQYAETKDWIVVTDRESYIIPYGIKPSVVVGQTLPSRTTLAEWVILKDYVHNGDWWINVRIPERLFPNIPSNVSGRVASAGSDADYIMREYLKHHTFLIRIDTLSVGNSAALRTMHSLIHYVKPAYTYPIYVWSIPSLEDFIHLEDEVERLQLALTVQDPLAVDMSKFVRDAEVPFKRDFAGFIRFNMPEQRFHDIGFEESSYVDITTIDGYEFTGAMNYHSVMREEGDPLTEEETYIRGWARAILSRSNHNFRDRRERSFFMRNYDVYIPEQREVISTGEIDGNKILGNDINGEQSPLSETINVLVPDPEGVGVFTDDIRLKIPQKYFSILLYLTTEKDVVDKMAAIGKAMPPLGHRGCFFLKKDSLYSGDINSPYINLAEIDGTPEVESLTIDPPTLVVQSWDNLLFSRTPSVTRLHKIVPIHGYRQFDILDPSTLCNLDDGGFLCFIKSIGEIWSCMWITNDLLIRSPKVFEVKGGESISLEMSEHVLGRGSKYSRSQYMNVRGIPTTYEDSVNPPTPVGDRSGRASIRTRSNII